MLVILITIKTMIELFIYCNETETSHFISILFIKSI